MTNTNTTSFRSRQLLASMALLAASQQTLAAELEEVLVTAQKREESASDIPIAISTYTGDELMDIGITDTRDLDKLVPGFTVGESGFGTPIYTMRGVGFNGNRFPVHSQLCTRGLEEIQIPVRILVLAPV